MAEAYDDTWVECSVGTITATKPIGAGIRLYASQPPGVMAEGQLIDIVLFPQDLLRVDLRVNVTGDPDVFVVQLGDRIEINRGWMNPTVDTVDVSLTQDQLRSAISALYDAKVQNDIYRARSRTQNHDPCCQAEARREQQREEMYAALEQTRDHIVGAIAALESKEIR